MNERILLGALLGVAIYFFWTQRLRSDLAALMVMLVLIVPWPHADGKIHGILTPEEGFSGFGSSATIMVTAMFVFGGALAKTGAAEFLAMRVFKAVSGREWTLQAALLGTTVLVSMFVNDTTVVLVFLPMIMSICSELKASPSRFLLLAAYGSLLGGQWTLIGTRSNLLISDYMRHRMGTGLGFFDFTPVAAAIFVLVVLFILFVGRRFLPHSSRSGRRESQREYLSELVITSESKGVGKSFEETGWSARKDVDVVELLRDKRRLSVKEPLKAGDMIIMRGAPAAVGEMLKSPDFKLKEEIRISEETLQSVNLVTVEALVSPRSDYVGQRLNELHLKRDYGFTVLGLSHHGRKLRRRRPAATLAFGDSLLLLGESGDLERLRRNSNLTMLAEESFPALGKRKAFVASLLLLGVIALAMSNAVSPVITIPIAAFLSILLGCINVRDAYGSVDWPSVVTVASMIPFGVALEKTGTAADIANYVVQNFSRWGPHATLGAVLLVAIVLTQLIENAAVAVIMSPLAYSVAEAIKVNPKPFLVGLAICVSAGFCTPFAHESTIIVMNPGRYAFKHYLQIGIVLALITWLLATFLTPVIWPFQQSRP